MYPIGRFDMPFGRHADEATYVRALCLITCAAKCDYTAMGALELVCWAKLFHMFYLVMGADV